MVEDGEAAWGRCWLFFFDTGLQFGEDIVEGFGDEADNSSDGMGL